MTDHDEWNQADEVTKRLSGGKFLKFEPGDSYRVVPSGIPFAFEQHWLGDSSERCPGSGCTHCAKGRPAKARIRLNVFDLKENAMKIFESGSPFYRELKFFRNKYDGKGKPAFASMIFEITRHGVGKKTKYSIVPDGELTAEQKARVAAAPLHKLDGQEDGDEPDDDVQPPPALPAAVRDEFITRLKSLRSEEALYAFLGEFGCERIGDLDASDEPRARSFLETLERKKPDINPFS